METTDYADVLAEAAEEVSLDPANISVEEFSTLRRAAKKWLEKCWEYHFWPVLNRIEKRCFRYDWNSGTAYVATNEVFYPPTQKYYQALQASTNQAPADSAGVTNGTYWADSDVTYSASNWSATVTYAVGDRATYSGSVYQCFALGGSGAPSTDTTHWGILTAFDRYVDYAQTGQTAIGIVNGAWNANPRVSTRVDELNWSLSNNGVQVISPVAYAWLDYRIRCPKLSGAAYSATATYVSGNQIYYSSATTAGNFYIANASTSAGQSPDTTASKWDVVQLPRIFHKPLVYGIAAAWTRGPGGAATERSMAAAAEALGALEEQRTLLVGQQSQRVKTVVVTR